MGPNADNSSSCERDLLELLEQNLNQVSAGLFIDADESNQQVFDLLEQWIAENPPAHWNLTLEVNEHESNRDWPRVEATCQKILALAQEPCEHYAAHRDLAKFYELTSEGPRALTHARLATQAARNDGLNMLLLMAIRSEAAYLLKVSKLDLAGELITESFSLLKGGDDFLYKSMGGSSFTLRAHWHMLRGNVNQTALDLKAAFQLLEPPAQMESAGGVRSWLAYAWHVEGLLRSAQSDFEGAVEAGEQAVTLCRSVAQMPHCANVYSLASVANALQNLAKALRKVSRELEAQQAESECREIRSFLKIPETTTPP